MTKPVSGTTFSAPVNPPSLSTSSMRSTSTSSESEIRSMANADNGNCLCNPFTYLFDKIKSFLSWLFPSLFSSPIDEQQLQNRIQKGKEIISTHLRESLFSSSSYALDPSRYATIVKLIYNGEKEGYMVEQSLANPKAFLEGKIKQFLTKHASQTAGHFEVQTTFVYYQKAGEKVVIVENGKEEVFVGEKDKPVLTATACLAVMFPEDTIVRATPHDSFLQYAKMENESDIIRFSEYIHDDFADCVNQGPDSVFPSGTHEGSAFSGSCSEQLRNAIRALEPRS